MININIQNIITFIAINLDDPNVPNIDEFISDYQQIKPIEDPIFWLSCGAFICLMSGLIFADIMKSKLNNWTAENISPQPLENPRSISSWLSLLLWIPICKVKVVVALRISWRLKFAIEAIRLISPANSLNSVSIRARS